VRYVEGTADADINITGPRKLGAALQVIKGLKGCFVFWGCSICYAGSLPRGIWRQECLGEHTPAGLFCNAVSVLDGLRRDMFNIQENQEDVV